MQSRILCVPSNNPVIVSESTLAAAPPSWQSSYHVVPYQISQHC